MTDRREPAAHPIRDLLSALTAAQQARHEAEQQLMQPARTGCDDCLDARRQAEASLARVQQAARALVQEMRTIAVVAGQCSVEGPEDTRSRMAAAEADRCSTWADRLAALTGQPEDHP